MQTVGIAWPVSTSIFGGIERTVHGILIMFYFKGNHIDKALCCRDNVWLHGFSFSSSSRLLSLYVYYMVSFLENETVLCEILVLYLVKHII
jgi:hypothetical protein